MREILIMASILLLICGCPTEEPLDDDTAGDDDVDDDDTSDPDDLSEMLAEHLGGTNMPAVGAAVVVGTDLDAVISELIEGYVP